MGASHENSGDISGDIKVSFDKTKCIHARRCVLGLPNVFRPGTKGGWIFPENASVEEVAAVVRLCPSGALTYKRHDGGAAERADQVNTARLWENGPLEVRGDIEIKGQNGRYRAALCRCGRSANKPFCDGSHKAAEFKATCEAPADEKHSASTAKTGGALAITPIEDGPLLAKGNLEIIAGSGRRIAAVEKTALCRCGHSANKPFCDGAHAQYDFKAPGV